MTSSSSVPRPAVDPLFRTAARAYGPRVVGIILTGALDCGTAGLMSIKARRGIAVVQDPNEAVVPDMPCSAITHVKCDHVLPLSKIPSLLARLAQEPISGKEVVFMEMKKPKRLSTMTCPECHGSMTESEVNDLIRFECHVGHRFSLGGMAAAQAEVLESALWAGVRALEEGEDLARRISSRSERKIAGRLIEKADAMRNHADLLRNVLLGGDWMLSSDKTQQRRRRDQRNSK